MQKDKKKKTTSLSLNNQNAIELENYYNSDGESLENTAETNSFFVPITEYGKLNDDKTLKNAYTVSNMNLGIAERPRSELTITKDDKTSHVRIPKYAK